jgi:hypothetical protein
MRWDGPIADEYCTPVDYEHEHEHRFAAHEHEAGQEPEQDDPREWPIARVTGRMWRGP